MRADPSRAALPQVLRCEPREWDPTEAGDEMPANKALGRPRWRSLSLAAALCGRPTREIAAYVRAPSIPLNCVLKGYGWEPSRRYRQASLALACAYSERRCRACAFCWLRTRS